MGMVASLAGWVWSARSPEPAGTLTTAEASGSSTSGAHAQLGFTQFQLVRHDSGTRAVNPVGPERRAWSVRRCSIPPLVDISRGPRRGAKPRVPPCGPAASGPHFFLVRPS